MTWSCSKNDEGDPDDNKSLIVGTWKALSITNTTYINGQKDHEDSEDPEELADYIITFNADGTGHYEGDEPARYKVEGNKLTVYESDDPDDTDVLDIVTLTKTQLILQIVDEITGEDGKKYKYVEEDVLSRVK